MCLKSHLDYESDVDCVIEPQTSPSYVSATYRRITGGCSEENTTLLASTASRREIHLVRLASPVQVTSSRKESRGPKRIDLRIVSEDSGRNGNTSIYATV